MPRPTLLLLALLAVTTPAHAQPGDFGRHPRERPGADSTRTRSGLWQLWGHAGVGWVGSPRDVRSRYAAGMDIGLSGDRRVAGRLALRARLEYHDFPSRQPDFLFIDGFAYATSSEYGHGWSLSGLGGVSVRAWRHLWLEGGFGGGRFASGFPPGQSYVDSLSGRTLPLTGGTGWGAAWGAGARYEFKPTARDRILGEVQCVSLDRDGTTLRFWALRAGYRFF